MLLLDRMLIGGIRFVLDKVATSVDHELNDDTRLREELMAAQMRVELGEMTQEEFAALEDVVLERIRTIRERRGEGGPIDMGAGGAKGEGAQTWNAADITGIEASFVADDFHEDVVEGEVVPEASPAPTPGENPSSKSKAKKKRAKAGTTSRRRGSSKRRSPR